MKKAKKFEKKLVLVKQTMANLDNKKLENLRGGQLTFRLDCNTVLTNICNCTDETIICP